MCTFVVILFTYILLLKYFTHCIKSGFLSKFDGWANRCISVQDSITSLLCVFFFFSAKGIMNIGCASILENTKAASTPSQTYLIVLHEK